MGADIEPSSLKAQKQRLGHGHCLYGTVGGSGQRLVSNLVGEGTQCTPLKVNLRYHKTGYTGGTMLLYSVPGLAAGPQTCCVCAGALKLGLVQLRGFLTDYCREKYGLERPRPSPVCSFFVRGHCSGKFCWMGNSSSQRSFRLARDARPRVCALHAIRPARSGRVPALHGRTPVSYTHLTLPTKA